jgi:hypothetical protein
MTTAAELRAVRIADRTNAAVSKARDRLVDAIASRDSQAIVDEIGRYGVAAWEAGWDQCAADHQALLMKAGLLR